MGTEGAGKPFWSADSAWAAYGANGKLWKVPVDGGQPSAICELPENLWSRAAGGAWYPDGTIVFTTGDTFDPSTKEFIDMTGNRCLAKPFTVKGLKKTVSKMVDSLKPSSTREPVLAG